MTVYILSALLIIILAFAIYQLSKKSEVEEEIKKLKKRSQLSLMEELRASEKVVWLCFTGGLLLTANYAITYFSGSELVNIPNWGFIQWSGALIGLVVAVSITFVQKVLYSSPTHSKAGLVVTTLVLTFVIISEIGSPIEKEGMKMKEASQNSAVFKAVVSGITGKTDAGAGYSAQIANATAEKAQHEFELERCERHADKGEKRVKRCEDFENRAIAQAQAKIESYQSSASTTTSSNESSRIALIQQAKALEHNTDNHSELVKLTASVLGASFLSSMMFLSLVLIVAFEAGFHFVGSRIGVLKTALGEMGNKEILRKQELSSLKNEKEFKDKSWNLKTNTTNKLGANKGYSPATAFNPTNQASNDVGFTQIKIHDADKSGLKMGTGSAANESQFKGKATETINRVSTPPTDRVSTESVDRVQPVKQGVDSVRLQPASNRVDSVSDTESTRLGVNIFDSLYKHLKQELLKGNINPTTRVMRAEAHGYIKQNSGTKNIKLSLPETANLVTNIFKKMMGEKFLIKNPNHKNGTAKYLVNKEEK
jgi:hypothetical protein